MQDSQGSAEAANLLSINRSNNTNQGHIVSQESQLPVLNDILSNIIQEDVSPNTLTIASDNSQIDTKSPKRQLCKEKKDTHISNQQRFTETNNSVILLQKKLANYRTVLIPIKLKNRIYSSIPRRIPVSLKSSIPIRSSVSLKSLLNIIKSSNNNQNSTVSQGSQLFLPGKDGIFNIRPQEDFSTINSINTVPQVHQSIIGGIGGNLYHRNTVPQTYNFPSNELSSQKPSENQFSKTPDNQPSNQFSNQTNGLIVDSISQQISLELSLSNEDTIYLLPTIQIPVEIVTEGEKSYQQSSIISLTDKYKVDKMLRKVKIAIVGAGASGIAAASRLLQEGINDFVVLEANDKIGGRINTVDFGDNVVDLGAQWVHGETGNVVCELASKHNLLGSFCTFFDASKHEFFTINGEKIPKEESIEALTIYYDMMKEAPDELNTAEGSFGDYFREKFYQICTEKTFANNNRIPQFLSWMEKAECSIECSDSLSDVSAKRLADYWECKGDSVQNWKERGYKTLFDLLMKKIPNGENGLPVMEKVEFHKVVTTIDYSSEEDVIVTTSDDCKYIASHVIFTASLGVLKKKHSTLFMPCLPPTKKRAIRGLSIGTANKIFMEFPYKWWSEDTVALNLICLEGNKKLFLQKYGEEYRWLCDVFSFYTVDYQPRVLCAWIVGKYARHMETLSDSDVSDGLYRLLQESIGKYYNVIQPTKILRSKWFTDEHFQGSYTFQSMNTEDLNVTPKDLAEPIIVNGKPVILFAGEATHDHYYSTVHGAVETGFREADRLIDFNQRRVNSHL